MTDGGSLTFVTDTMLTTWANQALAELREMMISEFGDDYFATVTSAKTTTNAKDLYDIVSDIGITDFFKLLGVDISFDGGTRWFTARRFEFAERNRWRDQLANVWGQYALPQYRLSGSNIMFRPAPDNAYTYRVWYIPALTRFVVASPSTTFDFVNGWDDFVACKMAIRALQKEESDASQLERDLANIYQRIAGAVRHRDAGAPRRVQDTARRAPRNFLNDDEWNP